MRSNLLMILLMVIIIISYWHTHTHAHGSIPGDQSDTVNWHLRTIGQEKKDPSKGSTEPANSEIFPAEPSR
jgi:hypothetical protein